MTNRPKGKLFALLAIFVAIGLVTATGAFTTATAQRTADVSTVGDDAALLGLGVGSGASASDYVTVNNGELEITLSNVNANATTTAVQVINITNNGGQEVAVNITRTGANTGAIAFAVLGGELAGTTPAADITWANQDAYRIDDGGTPIDLGSGESIQVGIYIDTSDGDVSNGLTAGGAGVIGQNTEIINLVEIFANADAVDGNDDSATGNYDAAP